MSKRILIRLCKKHARNLKSNSCMFDYLHINFIYRLSDRISQFALLTSIPVGSLYNHGKQNCIEIPAVSDSDMYTCRFHLHTASCLIETGFVNASFFVPSSTCYRSLVLLVFDSQGHIIIILFTAITRLCDNVSG